MRLTWEHSEYSSEGIELEAVDDVAKLTHFDGHEDASGGQQEDVQALRNNAQPQHSCGENGCGNGNRKEEDVAAVGANIWVSDGAGAVIGGERWG